MRDRESRSGLSIAVLGRSVKFIRQAKLITDNEPVYGNIEEFLIHGFSYVFPIDNGKLTRRFVSGIDTTTLKSDYIAGDLAGEPDGKTEMVYQRILRVTNTG